jgi:hypothetical protein
MDEIAIPIAAPVSQGFPGRRGSLASLPLYIIESLLLYPIRLTRGGKACLTSTQ